MLIFVGMLAFCVLVDLGHNVKTVGNIGWERVGHNRAGKLRIVVEKVIHSPPFWIYNQNRVILQFFDGHKI